MKLVRKTEFAATITLENFFATDCHQGAELELHRESAFELLSLMENHRSDGIGRHTSSSPHASHARQSPHQSPRLPPGPWSFSRSALARNHGLGRFDQRQDELQAAGAFGLHVYAAWGDHGSVLAEVAGELPQVAAARVGVTAADLESMPHGERHLGTGHRAV